MSEDKKLKQAKKKYVELRKQWLQEQTKGSGELSADAGETAGRAARDDSSSGDLVAELRNENDTLRQRIRVLENQVLSLQHENALLKSPETEVSLSPPLAATTRASRAFSSSSFVEADLYSESVATAREKLASFKDWQLDLREWRTLGFGPKISL